jgi:dihydrodiol dehydrogenase / D-xylose 1-dehydrogenase (NADP)
VEIIYVASLHPYHKNGAILALQNGKHVLVEKPFGMNAVEATEMIDLAREKKLFLMEAMWTRYFPIIARIRTLISKGKIGKVTSMQASFGFKADPTVPRLSQKDLGAGALLDVGVYVVSLASMIFGSKDPLQIRAIGELDDSGVDQQIGMVLAYPDGIAILHTAFNSDLPNEATIIGTEGRIKIHKPLWCPTRFSWHLSNGEADEEDYPLPKVDGHFNFTNSAGLHFEAKYVQQSVAAGKTESDLHNLTETLQIMQTMDEIREQIGLHYKAPAQH